MPGTTTGSNLRHISRRLAVAGFAFVAAALAVAGDRAVLRNAALARTDASVETTQAISGPPSFADVVDVVKPAVIGVRSKLAVDLGDDKIASLNRLFRQTPQDNTDPPNADTSDDARRPPAHVTLTAQASGFLVSPDGYAVTNHHAVERSKTVEIQTDDNKTYTARVVGRDVTSDLALLKIDGRDDFPFVELADALPRVGDWILTVGNPFGLGGTVTAGIVSARQRDIGSFSYEDLIQIDAPVNKGNSGGPTFDRSGKVIGVNTIIVSPSGGSIGIAFAIPASTVKNVIAQLKDNGAVRRGWLGVEMQPVTKEIAESLGLSAMEGAIIAEVEAESPAARAGLAPGDVIDQLDGETVKDARVLSRAFASVAPGTAVQLGVLHDGTRKTIKVTLGQQPRAPAADVERETAKQPADLGLKLEPASKFAGSDAKGLIVTDVDAAGIAADHGIELGDVILDVAGKPATSARDVHEAINKARHDGKPSVLLRVKSGDATQFVALPVG